VVLDTLITLCFPMTIESSLMLHTPFGHDCIVCLNYVVCSSMPYIPLYRRFLCHFSFVPAITSFPASFLIP
jgi:hypothetical protein